MFRVLLNLFLYCVLSTALCPLTPLFAEEKLLITLGMPQGFVSSRQNQMTFRVDVLNNTEIKTLTSLSWEVKKRKIEGATKEEVVALWEKPIAWNQGATSVTIVQKNNEEQRHLKTVYKNCSYDFWLTMQGDMLISHGDPDFSFDRPLFQNNQSVDSPLCPSVEFSSDRGIFINHWATKRSLKGNSYFLSNSGPLYVDESFSWVAAKGIINKGECYLKGEASITRKKN